MLVVFGVVGVVMCWFVTPDIAFEYSLYWVNFEIT